MAAVKCLVVALFCAIAGTNLADAVECYNCTYSNVTEDAGNCKVPNNDTLTVSCNGSCTVETVSEAGIENTSRSCAADCVESSMTNSSGMNWNTSCCTTDRCNSASTVLMESSQASASPPSDSPEPPSSPSEPPSSSPPSSPVSLPSAPPAAPNITCYACNHSTCMIGDVASCRTTSSQTPTASCAGQCSATIISGTFEVITVRSCAPNCIELSESFFGQQTNISCCTSDYCNSEGFQENLTTSTYDSTEVMPDALQDNSTMSTSDSTEVMPDENTTVVNCFVCSTGFGDDPDSCGNIDRTTPTEQCAGQCSVTVTAAFGGSSISRMCSPSCSGSSSTFLGIKSSTVCCNGDYCNSEDLESLETQTPMPTVINSAVVCYSCIYSNMDGDKDSCKKTNGGTATMSCDGQCGIEIAFATGMEIASRMCMTTCKEGTTYNDGVKMAIFCCSGDLCNSEKLSTAVLPPSLTQTQSDGHISTYCYVCSYSNLFADINGCKISDHKTPTEPCGGKCSVSITSGYATEIIVRACDPVCTEETQETPGVRKSVLCCTGHLCNSEKLEQGLQLKNGANRSELSAVVFILVAVTAVFLHDSFLSLGH